MRKVDRSAFLYMESQRGAKETFAQCGTCAMFDRDNEICAIMDRRVNGDDGTCAVYLEGPHSFEYPRVLAYPEDIGYEERQVRCENCQFGGERCGLYLQLNSMFPDIFNLDTRISPYGCCNANTPVET